MISVSSLSMGILFWQMHLNTTTDFYSHLLTSLYTFIFPFYFNRSSMDCYTFALSSIAIFIKSSFFVKTTTSSVLQNPFSQTFFSLSSEMMIWLMKFRRIFPLMFNGRTPLLLIRLLMFYPFG